MDLQATKIELAKLILNLDNKKLIDKVIDLIKSEQADFWAEMTKEEKAEIHLGIGQLDKGEKTSFDEFLKKVS